MGAFEKNNFEFDFNKIIALSTLNQLGLIISILAKGRYKLAFFHLLIKCILLGAYVPLVV